MILEKINLEKGRKILREVFPETPDAEAWLDHVQTRVFPGDEKDFAFEAAECGEMCQSARQWLSKLPLKSKRDENQNEAGKILVNGMAGLCWKFSKVYHGKIFDEASKNSGHSQRLEDLAESASRLCPKLYPSRVELKEEQNQLLRDKDGLELHQGLLFSHWFANQEIGSKLIREMRQPLPEALARQEELQKKKFVDLEYARVELQDDVAAVYLSNPGYLNSEDDTTLEPTEIAVDLALLNPSVKVGFLRGETLHHPKYLGRRVFSSGINLTRLYQGTQSYLFYLTRELGLVNKLFRGHSGPEWLGDELEQGREIPWIAVVEGFAIGGGCQLLLVMDYVLAETGSYLNLPARKEGIIPGCANLRLPRMVGDRLAYQAILFDRQFPVDSSESAALVNEVCKRADIENQLKQTLRRVSDSGLVSASGNRKALRAGAEPIDSFRRYMAQYAYEQVFCHLSPELVGNLEKNWKERRR